MRKDTIISVGGKAVGRKKRNRSTAAVPPEKRPSWLRRHAFWIGITAFAVATIAATRYLPGSGANQAPTVVTPAVPTPEPVKPTVQKAFTLDKLLAMPVEQLADVDIAEMNLLCAKGLPGAENLDVAHAMARLDGWAAMVKLDTERHLYRFVQNPGNYENSEGYFRMLSLITVLQGDLDVRYNPERIREIDFRRSQDLFIHGMIDSDNGGTCVSMPVIYTAVARRLGYPVKLVLTKAHVFCRWDEPGDRVNVEATNQGLNTYPDDYYLTWPMKVSKVEAERNRYLVSLSPGEELACFLASRGHCLMGNGQPQEALAAYTAAHRLAPETPVYLAWAQETRAKLNPAVAGRRPAGMRVPMVYRNTDPLAEIERINAINRANMQRTHPQVPGVPQPPSPYGPQPPDPYRPQPYGPPPTPGSGQR